MKEVGRSPGHDTEAPATTEKISANAKRPDRSYRTPSGNGRQEVLPGVPYVGIDAGIDASSQVSIPAQRRPSTGSAHPTELFAEVSRLVNRTVEMARSGSGCIPGVGQPEWWTAPPLTRIAAIMVLGEAFLCRDAERLERLDLKEVAVDISAAHDWKRASQRPSYQELVRRRAVIT
jgi:hypothetical protein